MTTMPLEEFVIKSAERYIELKDMFPNDTQPRMDLTSDVLTYLESQGLPPFEVSMYLTMYYKLRGA